MIISEYEQGTIGWHADRAGVITASMFSTVRAKVGLLNEQQQTYVNVILGGGSEADAKAMAGYKSVPTSTTIQKALRGDRIGEWSETAKNYAFRLACERIAGQPLAEQIETFAMRRGKELEEACRQAHEVHLNDLSDLAGFCMTDDRKFGCSADALVGEDGGGEYKCFYDPTMVRPILIDNDWGNIMDQVQGCLWITGRKWWDMCLYIPALVTVDRHFTCQRVARDDNYIERMETDLVEFDQLVTETEAKLRR